MRPSRTLGEVLKSVSDVLFPDGAGETPVSVNSTGYSGDTPLHVMAWRNDINGAETLIDAGVDVNAQGEMDETALHIALTRENHALARLLLECGARTDLRCEFGDTPWERARALGEPFSGLLQEFSK